jgi:hypothetical protein
VVKLVYDHQVLQQIFQKHHVLLMEQIWLCEMRNNEELHRIQVNQNQLVNNRKGMLILLIDHTRDVHAGAAAPRSRQVFEKIIAVAARSR